MLTIEEFRTAIIGELNNRNTRPDVTFVPRDVKKNNGVTCLAITTVQSGDGKPMSISPVAYLETYYKAYRDGRSLAECIDFMEQAFENNSKPDGIDEFTNEIFEFDAIKDRLFLAPVNADKNKTLLMDAPHLMKEDIALVCRVKLSEDDNNGIGTVLVRDNLLAAWGVTADEVCAIAKENTPKLFPAEVTTMADMLREMMLADGMPSEMVDEFVTGPMNDSMYVVTNKQKIHGAVAVFYDGVLDDLVKKLDSEKLYILPSSIHEVIVIGSTLVENGAMGLSDLVKTVNVQEVDEVDQLSDHAYCYDSVTKTFSSLS